MKRLVFLLFILTCFDVFGQTATDKNGNKIYNGNSVAIFTHVAKYAVGGLMDIREAIPGELESELQTAFNVMVTSVAQNHGLQVVNRDNEAFIKTQKWLQETKSEDYIDGLSVRAKSIGATHILLQDLTVYTYGNAYIVLEVMNNIISVQTNISKRNIRRYRISINASSDEISDIITQEKNAVRNYFMNAFPAFFVLYKTSRNTAFLYPTSAFGVDTKDKVFFYYWENVQFSVQGQNYNFSKMEQISIGTEPEAVNGSLHVKLDKKLSVSDNLVIKLGDILHSEITTYAHVPLSFSGFISSGNAYEDYCRKQINNAVYNALYDYACVNLIESENLAVIKAERNLQKTEDFIDGSVIEQFKASGARYILNTSEFSNDQDIVRFKMSVVDISAGTVVKEFLINCHISRLDEVVKYYINQIFVAPIAIGKVAGRQIDVYPVLPIASSEGESFSILYNKSIVDPISGKNIYSRIEIAKCTLSKWNGQEYVLTIDEVLSKDDFSAIADTKSTDLFYLMKNVPVPENMNNISK